MSGFLIDTNCVSELVATKPNLRVMQWFDSANESMLYLSVLTLGEIRKGLAVLPQSKRRTKLEMWVELDLKPRFVNRILPIDDKIADRWGLLSAQARKDGRPLPIIDGLLAATAMHHELTIVTRNAVDFFQTKIPVFDPWK